MRTLIRRLRAATTPAEPGVHFHAGPQARPAVCDDARCTAPHLSV